MYRRHMLMTGFQSIKQENAQITDIKTANMSKNADAILSISISFKFVICIETTSPSSSSSSLVGECYEGAEGLMKNMTVFVLVGREREWVSYCSLYWHLEFKIGRAHV